MVRDSDTPSTAATLPAREAIGATPPGRFRFNSDRTLRWVFPIPALLLIVALTLIPLVRTVILSLTETAYGETSGFVGLENYARLVGDRSFWATLWTTGVFTVAAVGGELLLGWILALLLYGSVSRWKSTARTLFLIPMTLSPVVVGITWRALLNPSVGWVNQLLGIEGFAWFSTGTALFTLVAVDIWQWTPMVFVLILSGLQGMPGEVLEAASVDGASAWQRFRHVIFPLMLPITAVVALLRALDAFRQFDLVFNLTMGGPGTVTETISFYIYRLAFRQFDQGYASGASILLSVIVGILVTIYLRYAFRQSKAGT